MQLIHALCLLLWGVGTAEAFLVAAAARKVPRRGILPPRVALKCMQPPEDDAAPAEAKKELTYEEAVKQEAEGGYRTVYDDESDFVEKPGISDEMRARLLRGQQQLGADPNSKNPFLYAFAAVGIFVALGALAVNM